MGRRLIGPWLDRIGGEMNRLTLKALDLQPRDRVLEVGFGGGDLLASILGGTGGAVFGVDLSAAMVARARRRFRGEERLALFQGSAEALPLPDASVDKACSVSNIYFWSDPVAVMAEFARVIRPGGTLAICFEPAEELRKWPGHRFGFRLYEKDEVEALLVAAGFGDLEVRSGRGRKPDYFLCLSARRLGAERKP